MEELAARLVDPLIRMRAKEVALRLQQVRRQPRRPIAVIERQRGRKRRRRHAQLDCMDQRLPPARLVLVQRTRKEVVHQQVLQLRVLVERLLDVAEECRADDAAATPHQGHAAHIQVPTLYLLGRTQQHVALRIADHLRAVQRPPHFFNELRLVLGRNLLSVLRPRQRLRRRYALVFQRTQATSEHALADKRHRNAVVQRVDGRPLTRTLLSRSVQNFVQNRRAVVVLLPKNRCRNLNKVAVKLTLVPLRKDFRKLIRRQTQPILQQLVGLADQLHIAVLDAVVHHLDVVSGAILPHPVAAGSAVGNLRRDRLKNILHCGHASALPPGMIDGPNRAPSSPPETPVPINSIPFAARSFVRRFESVYSEFPPSIMMSPFSRYGSTCSIVWSTTSPALTIIITRRGSFNRPHISSIECAPTTLV